MVQVQSEIIHTFNCFYTIYLKIFLTYIPTYCLQVETSSGAVNPASFEMNSRCPDEIVRRIRVSVSSYDPNWQGRLLETYDTRSDAFEIAPACWCVS